jgi:hypothetical protein
VSHSNVISGTGKKNHKIHELPKIPMGLFGCVGRDGVLTGVLYMPDVMEIEALTMINFTYFQMFLFTAVLALYTCSCVYVVAY